MDTRALTLVASICLTSIGWGVVQARTPQSIGVRGAMQVTAVPEEPRAVFAKYCVTCHNSRAKVADLALDTAGEPGTPEGGAIWEHVVRKLHTRTMPPAGSARPDERTYDRAIAWLEGELDRAAADRPDPGRPLLRRLNRTEYGNAIHDLLGIDVDVSALLPADDSAFGFDNISDVLGLSPTLLERYLVAADRISEVAVGAPDIEPGSRTYRVRQDRSQDQHIEGLPLGTVGGLAAEHYFPLDAEYRFSLELYRTNLEAIRGLEHPHRVEITVDGQVVFHDVIGGERDRGGQGSITDRSDAIDARLQVQVPVTAGPHTIGATFVRKVGAGTQRLRPFLRSSAGTYDSTGRPHIETLTVAGPFNPTGRGTTPSRERIFVCRPPSASDDEPCARSIVTTVARRAFRRPATETEIGALLAFYRAGREKGGFDTGIQMVLRRILASPTFVFRLEKEPAGTPPGGVYRVNAFELASRLSFFLWSTIPDDALLDAAAAGELSTPEGLERQVRRMLADPRASALSEHFAGQWLHVRNLRNIVPNHDRFPDFDDTLRDAFRRETELFFDSIVREDRPVMHLLTADHTYLNERLAKHYGAPHVYGSHFRRVTLEDDSRRGLLGKGSLLMATSHADRTAPVLRGKWILENIFGTPPPPPPADVPQLTEGETSAPTTLRARLEMHRASPACASCHRVMDPLGFAMENFDAVGAWRDADGGQPIDASGLLADGTPVDGVVALREALVSRSDVFVRTLTEKLLTYAIGRGLEPRDMPVVREIVRAAGQDDYRFSSIVLGITRSLPFQMRMKAAARSDALGAVARVRRSG